MKAEKIYNIVIQTIRAIDDSPEGISRENMLRMIEDGQTMGDYKPPITTLLVNLGNAAREEMQRDHAKEAGQAKPRAAALRIIKNCNPARELIKGAFTVDGKQIVCDMFRIVRFYTPVELPKAAGDKTILKYLQEAKKACNIPCECWSAAEIKDYIAACKALGLVYSDGKKKTVAIDLPSGHRFNAAYLLDMLEAIPDAKIYSSSSYASPVYIAGENADGILCPIRKATASPTQNPDTVSAATVNEIKMQELKAAMQD